MRKQQVRDLVLGETKRVDSSRLFGLDGFHQERHRLLAQQRFDNVNPQKGLMQISLTNVKSEKVLMSVRYSLKYSYMFNPTEEDSEFRPRSSMFQKTSLIACDIASVINVKIERTVHISSGLVLHQMTSDHNRSELRIQDHNNEQSSSKLVPKVIP
ncbi:hypothetical protein Tco_0384781 [Tanacetum coccineum]